MRYLIVVDANTQESTNVFILRSIKTENKYAFDFDRFAGEPNA